MLITKFRYHTSQSKPVYLNILWIAFLVLSVQSIAQDETVIRTYIDKKDLKKVQKADEYLRKADVLNEEANLLYQQVFSVQADPELSEPEIEKKVNKLESSALKNQEMASSLYEKGNEIRFILYQKYLDRFWSSPEGKDQSFENERLIVEQADESYFQAVNYRLDAMGMDRGSARIELLTQAYELEQVAVEKQLTALAACYGIAPVPEESGISSEPAGQEVQDAFAANRDSGVSDQVSEQVSDEPEQSQAGQQESTLPAQIEVDQEMIDMYRRYMESGQYVDSTVLTSEMTGVTSFERDRILDLWYRYRYGDAVPLMADENSADSAASPAATDKGISDATRTVEGVVAQQSSSDREEMELGVVTDENRSIIVPADETVIYRVQVSASRSELSQRALRNIYYGNKNVEMILEEGWYKYSVGDFDTYNEADEFRKSTAMDNAFIVAYRKGTSFTPVSPQAGSVSMDQASATEQQGRMPSGLLFRVQVAANRVPSTVAQIERIYAGNLPVEVVREEGWYKYQLLGVRLYADALRLIDDINVSGAFVVAYADGVKQELYQAVTESRELEKTVQTYGRRGYVNEIEFHVQLAATRSVLRTENLSRLYAGPEPVSVIFEEGWYKYRIKTGNSYEDAVRIEKECDIPDAFIVPYRRGARITIAEALQELK